MRGKGRLGSVLIQLAGHRELFHRRYDPRGSIFVPIRLAAAKRSRFFLGRFAARPLSLRQRNGLHDGQGMARRRPHELFFGAGQVSSLQWIMIRIVNYFPAVDRGLATRNRGTLGEKFTLRLPGIKVNPNDFKSTYYQR